MLQPIFPQAQVGKLNANLITKHQLIATLPSNSPAVLWRFKDRNFNILRSDAGVLLNILK